MSTIASQSPHDTSSTSATVPTVENIEPIAGTSAAADANVPQLLVHEVEGKFRKHPILVGLIHKFMITKSKSIELIKHWPMKRENYDQFQYGFYYLILLSFDIDTDCMYYCFVG